VPVEFFRRAEHVDLFLGTIMFNPDRNPAWNIGCRYSSDAHVPPMPFQAHDATPRYTSSQTAADNELVRAVLSGRVVIVLTAFEFPYAGRLLIKDGFPVREIVP
jgi:hypothetical protein